MRRKISLYIGDKEVDLADQSFILFNYTMDDLSNPTIVKNSFSQQITLPGTPTNNKVFGGIWRSDHEPGSGGTGVDFNPAVKTSFTIYNELNEILESGYCRMDQIVKKPGGVEYKVTLYGGLGGFLYNLAYNSDGSKKTLADLSYLPTSVDQNDDLVLGMYVDAQGRILPSPTACYGGMVAVSPGDEVKIKNNGYLWMITAYKDGVVVPSAGTSGLYSWVVPSGVNGMIITYRQSEADKTLLITRSGSSEELDYMINANAVLNAWERQAGDTSKSSLWDILNFAPCYDGIPGGSFDATKAIVKAGNVGLSVPDGYATNSGYVLCNLEDKYTCLEAHDLRSYLQRPVIRFKSIIDAIAASYNNGGYTINLDSSFFTSSNPYYEKTWMTLPLLNTLDLQVTDNNGTLVPYIGTINIPNGGNVSTSYKVHLEMNPAIMVQDVPSGSSLWLHCTELGATIMTYIVFTATGYDSSDNPLASFTTYVGTIQPDDSTIPNMDIIGRFNSAGEWVGDPVSFDFEQQGLSKVVISWQFVATYFGDNPTHTPNDHEAFTSQTSFASVVTIDSYYQECTGLTNTWQSTSASSARSGVTITKRSLLSTDKSPADYLLSWCKMLGLVMVADKGTKKVTIMKRTTFYDGETIDLTGRVNISGDGVKVVPLAYDSKWYDFQLNYDAGEFANYYSNIYGRVFGSQRVNTGYEFNADAKDLLDGIAFRGAVEALENSKFFSDITNGSAKIPSLFLDGGNYQLRDSEGNITDFPLGVPVASAISWWNSTAKTYDFYSKPQFHNAGKAAYEERDTLLFLQSVINVASYTARIAVTDDNAIMLALNNNTPCWLLEDQLDNNAHQAVHMPFFSRYYRVSGVVNASLDFGIPAEIPIPDISVPSSASVYGQYWQKYVTDRYDDASKVMTCKVNLGGYRVDDALLRHFYYYDGAIWAMNRIINYSLTTYDDVECEFVKIQDKNNYRS